MSARLNALAAESSAVSVKPLVATPRPRDAEAALPYLVRLTQANSYRDPMIMLRTAGIKTSQFQTGTVPIDTIAGLLACDVDHIAHLDHIRGPDALRSKTRWLAGHEFPSSQIRLTSAHVCPECVRDDGYVSVFWGLRHAVACPKHQYSPVERCKACGRELRWRRPGLLKCGCGAPVARSPRSKRASEPVRTALALIHEWLLGSCPGGPDLIAAGYPLQALGTVRPAGLVALADRLADLPTIAGRATRRSREERGLDALHRVLEDWPAGFHRFLAGAIGKKSFPGYFPLGKQKGSLYSRLFRGPEPDTFPFLEAEFMRFGLEVCDWGRPVIFSGGHCCHCRCETRRGAASDRER